MKIGQIAGNQAVQGSDAPKDKTSIKSDDFKSFLAEEMSSGGNDTSNAATSVGTDSLMCAPLAMYSAMDVSMYNSTQGVVEAIQATTDKLDQIAQTVGDGNVSPRMVDKMISMLGKEADTLQQKLSTLPEGHPLRQAGDELGVLAYVESVKLQRGDYQ